MPLTAISWPYGMAVDKDEWHADVHPDSWVAATNVPITVIVGSNDLQKRPQAPGQAGETRLSRGQGWVASMQALAESLDRAPYVTFITIAGIGHDEAKMASHARKLFEE